MHFELITTGNIEHEHEESQSELVHHEEVLQIESDNEQETIATNDQETELNLEESQSDLVHHNEVLQVESEIDQEVAIDPDTQSDNNDTVINSRKEEETNVVSKKEMNVFPLHTLSLEKEMEIFFKKPFAVSNNDLEAIQERKDGKEDNTVNEVVEDNLDNKDSQCSSSTRRKRNKIEFDSEDGTSTETSYEYSDYYSYLQSIRSTNGRRPNAAAPPSQQQEGFFTRMRRFFCC